MTEEPIGPKPEFLTLPDGETIAYHRLEGKSPCVVFLCGYKSDMNGSKALVLEEFCRERGQAFLRFDYTGNGESSGDFEDGTIGRWASDAVAAIDALTEGPLVLVGSSMGGWIMLLSAIARKERIAGLLGLAPAPDFTEELIKPALLPEQKADLKTNGVMYLPNPYGEEPTPVTQTFLEDGANQVVLDRQIPLDVPVRLIHGQEDTDVPWQTSLKIAKLMKSADVEVTLVKCGTHRLSEPDDMDRLRNTLTQLLEKSECV